MQKQAVDCIFLGSKQAGLELLKVVSSNNPEVNWHIIHPDDSSDLRSVSHDFKELAIQLGAPFHVVKNMKEASGIIEGISANTALVCGWYWLISQKVLDRFSMGVWGLHHSLLPKYRGNAPLVWAMINGEEVVGSSLFRIGAGMDDGPIATQVKVQVGVEDTIASVLDRLNVKASAATSEIWGDIIDGKHQLLKQDESQSTYCGLRIPEDGEIDWSQDSLRVHNFIRAQSSPYPRAFFTLFGNKYHVEKSKMWPTKFYGVPGQVLMIKKNSVVMSCGGGTALEILEIYSDCILKNPAEILGSLKLRILS